MLKKSKKKLFSFFKQVSQIQLSRHLATVKDHHRWSKLEIPFCLRTQLSLKLQRNTIEPTLRYSFNKNLIRSKSLRRGSSKYWFPTKNYLETRKTEIWKQRFEMITINNTKSNIRCPTKLINTTRTIHFPLFLLNNLLHSLFSWRYCLLGGWTVTFQS